MLKKTQKSNQSLSKAKSYQPEKSIFQYQTQAAIISFKSQLGRLSCMIEEETKQRKQSQKKMLSMLKHLQETKKSKLPSRPQISIMNKLFFSSKCETNKSDNENDSKNVLMAMNFQRKQQIQKTSSKLLQFQKEISNLYEKFSSQSSLNGRLNSIEQQIAIIKNSCSQIKYDFSTQVVSIREQIDSIQSLLIKTSQNWSEELKNKTQFAFKDIKEFVWQLKEAAEKRNQFNLNSIENSLRILGQKLSNIGNEATLAFNGIEQQVKLASQSIIETKQSIEQTFYGSQHSKEQFDSTSSLDCGGQALNGVKKEKERWLIQKRVASVQRRLGLLYKEYLSQPLHKL